MNPTETEAVPSQYGHTDTQAHEHVRPPVVRAVTPVGLDVEVHVERLPYDRASLSVRLGALARALDHRRGVLLTSGFEYPGRYTRWDVGFVDPPLSLSGRGRRFAIEALNARGELLLPACLRALSGCAPVTLAAGPPTHIRGEVAPDATPFSEEARTRRPGLITVLRCLRDAFATTAAPHLGFYGAFGYDLVFQFEDLVQRMPRPAHQRDLQLFLPDRLLVVDHQRQTAQQLTYELGVAGRSTHDLPRETVDTPRHTPTPVGADTAPSEVSFELPDGGFEALVERARGAFSRGDLFEVTPSQRMSTSCRVAPSAVFEVLCRDNPSPYGFLVNLGDGEHLIGASPEMFVRVTGRRVETCPIAGTIARGDDPLADADQVLALLSSRKDADELTMCTDVDRNDKARVCEPGSVRVLGRRQIEMYSRLIHTVDHVEGTLRTGYDGLDALVSHGWAVTVTGAPKPDAMQFIEDHEPSPRGFYGGAVGVVGLDGGLNTGLILRTIHLRHGRAEVRAGATLLHASEPAAEARECQLKASALLGALAQAARGHGQGHVDDGPAGSAPTSAGTSPKTPVAASGPRRRRVLLVDHRDSFVHTLGDYFRQLGAEVSTWRAGFPLARIDAHAPDLVVLSPGPGRPDDFATGALLAHLADRGVPAFGVCLGMQAMVEHAGGSLDVLATPRHGSPSRLHQLSGPLFEGLPRAGLQVGRYHSLYTTPAALPPGLTMHAISEDDGCVMAVAHRELPFMGVQFHPESIMSATRGAGLRLLDNALSALT